MEPSEKSVMRRRREETTAQFWQEADVQGNRLGLKPWDQKMCCYYICGMPSWKALTTTMREFEEEFPEKTVPAHISGVRRLAEQMLGRAAWREFQDWARIRSQELYALNLHEYDWQFKDSEIELRYLLDAAKQQMEKAQVLTSDILYAIIQATKELNTMYKYNGPNFDSQKAKLVIFMGDDDLED